MCNDEPTGSVRAVTYVPAPEILEIPFSVVVLQPLPNQPDDRRIQDFRMVHLQARNMKEAQKEVAARGLHGILHQFAGVV